MNLGRLGKMGINSWDLIPWPFELQTISSILTKGSEPAPRFWGSIFELKLLNSTSNQSYDAWHISAAHHLMSAGKRIEDLKTEVWFVDCRCSLQHLGDKSRNLFGPVFIFGYLIIVLMGHLIPCRAGLSQSSSIFFCPVMSVCPICPSICQGRGAGHCQWAVGWQGGIAVAVLWAASKTEQVSLFYWPC